MPQAGTLVITKEQARRFLLAHQGLSSPLEFEGKAGILNYIHRVGCIQYDPLNIVGRNQDLVLQSRISGFRPSMLSELLYEDRKLVDAWDKNMSIYAVEDWPYFERNRESARRSLGDSHRPAVAILPQVRRDIEERGPLSSSDLDYSEKVNWSWAPTRLSRAVLESMYFWGELILYKRVGTRRIYDLASRHITSSLLDAPDPNQSEEDFHDWYVLRRLGSVGLLWNTGHGWLGISGMGSRQRSQAFERLVESGRAIAVQVEGLKSLLYLRSEDLPHLECSLNSPEPTPQAALLAPLDNMLWDRRLVKEIFDFDYIWEVYKPMAERRFGYYVLPVLHGSRFVARFEPGRDKKSGALVIKNWWWEPGVDQSEALRADLVGCFNRFAEYLSTREVKPSDEAVAAGVGWLATV